MANFNPYADIDAAYFRDIDKKERKIMEIEALDDKIRNDDEMIADAIDNCLIADDEAFAKFRAELIAIWKSSHHKESAPMLESGQGIADMIEQAICDYAESEYKARGMDK